MWCDGVAMTRLGARVLCIGSGSAALESCACTTPAAVFGTFAAVAAAALPSTMADIKATTRLAPRGLMIRLMIGPKREISTIAEQLNIHTFQTVLLFQKLPINQNPAAPQTTLLVVVHERREPALAPESEHKQTPVASAPAAAVFML